MRGLRGGESRSADSLARVNPPPGCGTRGQAAYPYSVVELVALRRVAPRNSGATNIMD